MRVVLDTNILLSALIRRDSPPGAVLDAWFEDRFTLLTHAFQLDELRDVSRRPHIRMLFSRSQMGRLVNDIRAVAELIERLPPVRRSDDAADDFLLPCAKRATSTTWSPATRRACWGWATTAAPRS